MVLLVRQQARICLPGFNHTMRPGLRQERLLKDGISSFDMGGSAQPFWNSYYNLREALKTQSPELIILDAYAAAYDFEYSDDSRIIKKYICTKVVIKQKNELIIDNVLYGNKVANGVNVTVYNNVTNMVVDTFGVNYDDNCNIVR